MKRIAIYILLLAAAVLMPVEGTDVGKLVPVEVIQIYKEADAVVIATDLGESGSGAAAEEAIENLKATTSGIVFLDTAEYLLIDESASEEVIQLKAYLKPSVRVCYAAGETDLNEAAAYLNVHKPRIKLKTYETGTAAELLMVENGRMILKEK